ncbi:Acid trehalase [Cyphellophora attinorum]|uniref:alpha,alpha-trehalase n=1 Tax=Cyphellophora attinorum TaxID=1664694 RepID=A0A0N1HF84_9EURO|nr:Acid trehalase [Phialophora attinorum]KPI43775.1 Acid trehalase [Phialophora attinorum]
MQVPKLWTSLLSATALSGLVTYGTAQTLGRRQNGVSDVYDTRFDGTTWNNANWQLSTTTLDQGHYQARASIANGYIGINVASLGPFFEVDEPVDGDNVAGWPLTDRRQSFATIAGFWDSQPDTNGTNFPWLSQYGWESVISGVPHWSGIVVDLGDDAYLDATTNASQIQDFTSSLDMKRGLLSWAFTWSPPDSPSFNISYEMFAHKLEINKAFVQLNISASEDANVTVANVLNGDCALRTQPGDKGIDDDMVYSSVHPDGLMNVTGSVFAKMISTTNSSKQEELDRPYVGGNQSSIAAGLQLSLRAGVPVTVTKYVGIASSDAFQDPQAEAKNAVLSAINTGYADALASHVSEWAEVLPEHSVDDFSDPTNGSLPDDPYAVESAILAVANLFDFRWRLASDAYAGGIFWDAETWMQPGLVASSPYAARGISNYRMEHYEQAQKNIETAYQSSRNETTFSSDAAIFPWISARPGNCTAMGPCWDYEYHINGDIAQALVNEWIVSGDTDFFRENYFPIQNSVAVLYSDLLEKNGSEYSLTNMTDPDEFAANVDNGGFTMALIANQLTYTNFFRSLFNETPNETWIEQAENVLISRDQEADIILEYTGMNGSIDVKQADVVLITYPASYTDNYTDTQSLSDLDYYAAKQSQNGPAMTYAIFSIVANQVSPSGCSAYTYDLYSHHPYVRAPWFQFSEQLVDAYSVTGYHPAFPFLTGHGGANQVVLFGYLGLRLLPTSWALHVNPSLPPQIPQVRYRTFYWHGWPISAFSNQTHTTLSRPSNIVNASGTAPNSTYTEAAIPVVVARLVRLTPQRTPCLPMAQLLSSQIDNITSTKPRLAMFCNASGPSMPLRTSHLANSLRLLLMAPLARRGSHVRQQDRFAHSASYNFSVAMSNDTSSSGTVIASGHVNISIPFSEIDSAAITAPMSNTTFVDFMGNNTADLVPVGLGPEILTAEYATLTIWGSLYNSSYTAANMSGDGATVAEWEVIVLEDGEDASLVARGIESRVGKPSKMQVYEREMLGMAAREEKATRRRRGFRTAS